MTPAEAKDFLMLRSGAVRTMAQQEADRYARWPGQAISYLYGYRACANCGSRRDWR